MKPEYHKGPNPEFGEVQQRNRHVFEGEVGVSFA
jgi:hypothetical protein